MTHTALNSYVNNNDHCLYLPANGCEILMTSVQTSFPVTSALKIQAIYNEA
jgi:hypothetical protein